MAEFLKHAFTGLKPTPGVVLLEFLSLYCLEQGKIVVSLDPIMGAEVCTPVSPFMTDGILCRKGLILLVRNGEGLTSNAEAIAQYSPLAILHFRVLSY